MDETSKDFLTIAVENWGVISLWGERFFAAIGTAVLAVSAVAKIFGFNRFSKAADFVERFGWVDARRSGK